MDQLQHFISDHYITLGLVGLISVYLAAMAFGVSGRRTLLKSAMLRYVGIAIVVAATPLVLWLLSSS